jgi:hypothetical protein
MDAVGARTWEEGGRVDVTGGVENGPVAVVVAKAAVVGVHGEDDGESRMARTHKRFRKTDARTVSR